MKAIIIIKKGLYSKYYGQTFEVKEVLSSFISLDINNVTTDFTFKEIMIVDIQKEIQYYYEDQCWVTNHKASACYNNLRKYCETNNIGFEIKHFCPA